MKNYFIRLKVSLRGVPHFCGATRQSRPIKHGIATAFGLAMTIMILFSFLTPVLADNGVACDCQNPATGKIQKINFYTTPKVTDCAILCETYYPTKGIGSSLDIFKFTGSQAGFGAAGAQLEPEVVIGRIIEGALVIIGTIFGILMVYAGYLWMQARGNEEYVKKAKGILEAAIIGIILVMAAYAITAFIVSRVIGAAQFGL